MKYLGISGGRIIEGFSIIPSININWMWINDHTKIYDIQFAWLLWYFTIGQSNKWLKENGY